MTSALPASSSSTTARSPTAPSSAPSTAPASSSPRRARPTPPQQTASLGDLAKLYWFGAELSVGFITSAYRALTVARLNRGEAGIKLVSTAAKERNGISREHAHFMTFVDPTEMGKGLRMSDEEKVSKTSLALGGRGQG